MKNIGLVYDPYMMQHSADDDHPECPNRIASIYNKLLNTGNVSRMVAVKSRYAIDDELHSAHSKKYIEKAKRLLLDENTCEVFSSLHNSVYSNKDTYRCASLAAGSVAELTEQVAKDELDAGFAIVRPPGHHAYFDKAMGFCIFNNVAIGAATALKYVDRIAIIDFDIHHGNGTEDIMKRLYKKSDRIKFISIHKHDKGKFYPGTGSIKNNFSNITNIPLNNSDGTDEVYLKAFTANIIPELKQFAPKLIMVSAGFDAADGDLLGNYSLTPKCYSKITSMLKNTCSKIVMCLEGGYNLKSISECFNECVNAMYSEE